MSYAEYKYPTHLASLANLRPTGKFRVSLGWSSQRSLQGKQGVQGGGQMYSGGGLALAHYTAGAPEARRIIIK